MFMRRCVFEFIFDDIRTELDDSAVRELNVALIFSDESTGEESHCYGGFTGVGCTTNTPRFDDKALQHISMDSYTSLVQMGDKKACHVAMFIHSPLLSPRQEGRMNEYRDVTGFLVSRLNQALAYDISLFCKGFPA